MATMNTRAPETVTDDTAAYSAAGGLGDIVVRRDALQARARAEALLLTIRAVGRGIAAVRARRGNN